MKKGTMVKILDAFSNLIGYAAIRDHLPRAGNDREITLAVPGFKQIDSFSCSAVAGFMILKTFKPRTSLARFYSLVDPSPQLGAGAAKLVQALRRSRIGVSPQYHLTFPKLCQMIEQGFPVIAEIHNKDAEADHWVVVYGYGRRPDILFVANNSLPVLGRKRVSRREFERLWRPSGNGLVCWGK